MPKVRQRSEKLKFTINGMSIQNIRYADDKVLLAKSTADLKHLLYNFKEESEIRGLNINRKKKDNSVLEEQGAHKCKTILDDEEPRQVKGLNYL